MDYSTIDVRSILPQKGTAVYVDKVISFDAFCKCLEASKEIKENEYMLDGHFEHNPVVPGVFIVESLAQSCILCQYAIETNFSKIAAIKAKEYLLGKIDIKFRNKATIKDVLILHVKLVDVFLKIRAFKVKAIKKDTNEIVAQGEILVIENQIKGEAENLKE